MQSRADLQCPIATIPASALRWLLLLALCTVIVSVVLLAAVPPVARDELVHHLAVPKLYLAKGAMYEIPSMDFSYFPMNLEMLYLLPLALGSDILPKYFHFAFGLFTAGLIYGYLRQRLSVCYALFGAVLFLSTPVVVKLSTTAYVDLGLVFFSTLALLSLLRWHASGFRSRHLLIAALACGLALGTKYNGLVVFFLLTILVAYLRVRHTDSFLGGLTQVIKPALLFVLVSLAVFSPWMARNTLWTGNPIHPMFAHLFQLQEIDQASAPAQEEEPAKLNHFIYRKLIYGEDGLQIAMLPLRVFFQGRDGDPRLFDGKLNPFYLILPLFALLGVVRDRSEQALDRRVLLSFALLYFAIAFFTSPIRVRYLAPILPPLAILSMHGLKGLFDHAHRSQSRLLGSVLTWGVIAGLAGALLLNAVYIQGQFRTIDPFSYLSGQVSRDEYIERFRFEHPAMRFINAELPPDARVMFLFLGRRGYYCERDYLVDQQDWLARILNEKESSGGLRQALKAKEITHLLVYAPLFEKWAQNDLTAASRQSLKEFFSRSVQPLFSKNGVWLYRLKGAEA